MKEITLTRKGLFDLVWSEPMVELTKKYFISTSELKGICNEMQIPLPDSGYWTKIKYKSNVPIATLSDEYNGENEVIFKLMEDGDEKTIPHNSKLTLLQNIIEKDSNLKLKVPVRLVDPDELIISFRDSFKNHKTWEAYDGSIVHNYGIIRHNRDVIDINVSVKTIDRTLRIMDTIIKALKKRGCQFIIKNDSTYISIFKEEIVMIFREKQKRIIMKGKNYDSSDYELTGILYLKVGRSCNESTFIDGRKPLEEQIPRIIASIELKAIKIHQEKIENEKYWKEYREKEQRLNPT